MADAPLPMIHRDRALSFDYYESSPSSKDSTTYPASKRKNKRPIKKLRKVDEESEALDGRIGIPRNVIDIGRKWKTFISAEIAVTVQLGDDW